MEKAFNKLLDDPCIDVRSQISFLRKKVVKVNKKLDIDE